MDGTVVGAIGRGLVVLLAVGRNDCEKDADYLAEKIARLRIFPDRSDRMNVCAADCSASVLVVSQFTLYGDCRKGRRPSFDQAAPPGAASRLYEYFISQLQARGLETQAGVFQAAMQVYLVNDGPVTLILDSSRTF